MQSKLTESDSIAFSYLLNSLNRWSTISTLFTATVYPWRGVWYTIITGNYLVNGQYEFFSNEMRRYSNEATKRMGGRDSPTFMKMIVIRLMEWGFETNFNQCNLIYCVAGFPEAVFTLQMCGWHSAGFDAAIKPFFAVIIVTDTLLTLGLYSMCHQCLYFQMTSYVAGSKTQLSRRSMAMVFRFSCRIANVIISNFRWHCALTNKAL